MAVGGGGCGDARSGIAIPADAHNAPWHWEGWTQRQTSSPGICTYAWVDQNHASQDVEIQVLREYRYGFAYTLYCQNTWSRPPNSMYFRTEYYANGVWPPCYRTGWITNSFQSSYTYSYSGRDLWFYGCDRPAPLTVYQDVFTSVWSPFENRFLDGSIRPATQHDAYAW